MDIHIQQVKKDLDKVVSYALNRHPFYATVGFKLKTEVCTHFRGQPVPTAATDGSGMYINPDFWMSKPEAERITVWLHEVMHAALGHPLRRGNRDPYLFNVAADHEVNNILQAEGHECSSDWVCDPKYRGWYVERIYADLLENGAGKSEGDGDLVTDPGQNTGQGGGQPGTPDEAQPEMADGGSEGTAEEAPPEMPMGEVWDAMSDDGSALTQEEREQRLSDLAHDIASATNAVKMSGDSCSATAVRAIDKMQKPKKSWDRVFQQWVRDKGKVCGQTWSRLNRRAMVNRIYQPSDVKEGIGWMVIASDVSSSMDYAEHQALLAEADKMIKSYSIDRITILPFNSTVLQEEIVELKKGQLTPKKFKIGGGTSFAPVFNWVRRQNGKPDCIVVFTDLGDRGYGKPVPGVPVLWASSVPVYDGAGTWGSNRPPFGKVVEIELN